MKLVCRFYLAVFALFYSIHASAIPYLTDDQLRKAIGEVSGLLKTEGLEIEMHDAQKEGVGFPLMVAGLNLTNGVCLVFYNATLGDELGRFFAAVQTKDLSIWLNAIAVHEVTHCIEQREAYIRKRFDKVLPPGYPQNNLTAQDYLAVVKSGAVEKWGEALADIAAVLYFKQALPGEWMQFANGLAAMRDSLSEKHPEHNTAAWLRKIIAADAGRGDNQTFFEAAFYLRRQYRPE